MLCFQFFFSNSGSSEKLKFLLERQENLEKSLLEMIEKNFNVIDSKFEKSSNQNTNNLHQIKERISIIDRAQQNISGLTDNVIDLKNILSNTSQRGRFSEIILETLISDYLPKNNYEFQKTLSNSCRVDCILKTNGNLNNLCIDAKFPRESYEKIIKLLQDSNIDFILSRLIKNKDLYSLDILANEIDIIEFNKLIVDIENLGVDKLTFISNE